MVRRLQQRLWTYLGRGTVRRNDELDSLLSKHGLEKRKQVLWGDGGRLSEGVDGMVWIVLVVEGPGVGVCLSVAESLGEDRVSLAGIEAEAAEDEERVDAQVLPGADGGAEDGLQAEGGAAERGSQRLFDDQGLADVDVELVQSV
jgi:hypothetical protein